MAATNIQRRKRVNRLKKIIIGFILTAILIPSAISLVLMWQVHTLKGRLREAETTCDTLLETLADGSFHISEKEFPI